MEQLDLQGRKKGEFKVRLPDGRIQVTSYQAVNVDTFFSFHQILRSVNKEHIFQ